MSNEAKGKTNKFVVKLALSPNGDAGPFRRVGFGSFAGSHKKLCSASAELAAADSDQFRVIQYKMRLTYRDEDGDHCLLLNDNDVKMAVSESNKPLKVFAEILELSSVKANPTTSATASPNVAPREVEVPIQTRTEPDNIDEHPPALHQAVESFVGVLANAVIGLQQASVPTGATSVNESATESAPCASNDPVPEEVKEAKDSMPKEPKEERKFIHGRHTCDSCLATPVIGKRYHALNMADYDLCANCFESYTGEEIKFEEAELERDRPMQDRWHRRYAKWGTAGRPHARKHGGGRRQFGPRGRCGPRGPRGFPNAVPRGPPHAHLGIHFSPPCAGFSPPCAGPVASAPKEEALYPSVDDVDAALKEAIRRSMEDVKEAETQTETKETVAEGVQTEEPKAESELVVEPTPVVEEEIKVIVDQQEAEAPANVKPAPTIADVQPAPTPVDVKPAPPTSHPEESFVDPDAGETAAVLGDVMDQIALAIRGMNDELERETSQNQEDNDTDAEEVEADKEVVVATVEENPRDEKTGAVILGGDSNEDEVSQDSWDVVEDQAAHDESLARAAFAIGSALYESDLSASRANSNGNNPSVPASLESVPTTLPSLSSEVPLPTILLQKWHSHLEKLHELGFYNDALTIETLERLEAANIGCGVSDEISVTRLVNEMMKDM